MRWVWLGYWSFVAVLVVGFGAFAIVSASKEPPPTFEVEELFGPGAPVAGSEVRISGKVNGVSGKMTYIYDHKAPSNRQVNFVFVKGLPPIQEGTEVVLQGKLGAKTVFESIELLNGFRVK